MIAAAVLFAGPVLAGLVLGRVRGGRWDGLVDPGLRALWMLPFAAALEVAFRMAQIRASGAVLVVVLVWAAINVRFAPRRLRLPLTVLTAGIAANCLAILANGRMPYSTAAALVAGADAAGTTIRNAPATGSDTFLWAGDIIPVPPLGAVVSVGDLLLGAGTAILIMAAMLAPAADRRCRSDAGYGIFRALFDRRLEER